MKFKCVVEMVLKSDFWRNNPKFSFLNHTTEIVSTKNVFNTLKRKINPKQIDVQIMRDKLVFTVYSKKPLVKGREGNSIQYFSKYICKNYGFTKYLSGDKLLIRE